MTAQEALTKIKELGVNEISERNLKDWFAKRPLIQTTGAEIKRQANICGIELKRCDSVIPSEFMPIEEYEEKGLKVGTLFSEKEIEELYVKKGMTAQEMCDLKGCATGTFYYYLSCFGVKVIDKRQIKKEKLEAKLKSELKNIVAMYYEQDITIENISIKYETTQLIISNLLKDNGYKIRKRCTRNIVYKNKDVGACG